MHGANRPTWIEYDRKTRSVYRRLARYAWPHGPLQGAETDETGKAYAKFTGGHYRGHDQRPRARSGAAIPGAD